MKKLLTSITFIGICLTAFCQSDTIFKTNGEILLVDVTEVGENTIKYVYPKESFTNSIEKTAIAAVHFKSGRKAEFASTFNTSLVKSCMDWESVQFSKIESEVKGMQKINNVGAKAKGLTAYSSISKLQDRAYNKAKMEAAMLGGNIIYILEQNTEEAMYGGQYGSSKLPSVTISGIAYTSKKVFEHEIKYGDYKIESIYILETNAYELEKQPITTSEKINIQQSNIYTKNGFPRTKLGIKNVKQEIDEYTIIYAGEYEIVLSGINVTKNGKTTYYNIILKK
jgi:hypothetical protein